MEDPKFHSKRRGEGTKILFVLCLTCSLMTPLHAKEREDVTVLALQKDRIQVLNNLVKIRRMECENGEDSFSPLIRAMTELAEAQFEDAVTETERQAICSKAVARWKAFEVITMRGLKAGRVSQGEVLEVRASLLRWKIQAAKLAPQKN